MATRSIFLALYDPAGGARYVELSNGGDAVTDSKVYLPKTVGDDINLARKAPNATSYVEIEVVGRFVTLKRFGVEPCVLQTSDAEYIVPQSSYNQQYALLLRDQDQFTTTTGRWGLEWDDNKHSISHSMRPPEPPQPQAQITYDEIVLPSPHHDQSKNHGNKSIVSNIQLSDEATDTLELVDTTRQGEQDDADADDRLIETVNELARERRTESLTSESDYAPSLNNGRRAIKEQDSGSEHVASNTIDDSETESEDENRATATDPTPETKSKNKQSQRFNSGASKVHLTPSPSRAQGDLPESSILSPALRVPEQKSVKKNVTKKRKGRDETNAGLPAERPKRLRRQSAARDELATSESSTEEKINDTIEVARLAPPTHGRSKSSTAASDSPARSTRSHTTPHLSQRSTSTASAGLFDGEQPAVLFGSTTDIDEKSKTMSTFKSLGGKKVKRITEANIFCVGDSPLKKTGNLLLAIISGCDIVTDHWLAAVHRSNKFVDVSGFVPKDKQHEKEWGTTIKDAIARGKTGLTGLLAGKKLYLTAQLNQELGESKVRDLSNIATRLGADSFKSCLPKREPPAQAVILGTLGDVEGGMVSRMKRKLYHKDLLSMAVLRGKLELDSDEFSLQIPIKVEEESS